jgi:DNA replication protein DnaC
MRSHETNVHRPSVLIEHYLKQLKLPTVLREYKVTAAMCAKEGEDYIAFLARLCERELIEREQRAAQRRVKAAQFPVLKTLDTFDFGAQPSINRSLVLELMRGEYLSQHENILLLGNPGTGKTHLATALGHAACVQGHRVRFFSVIELVNQLLEAREDRQLQRLKKRIEEFHVLVLDEFGYVPFSKAGAELLFDVISRAYERRSIILTSNLPFEQWTEVLGNERLTGALLDRITHRVHILEANGQSFRLKDAKKRAKREQRENPEKPASPSVEDERQETAVADRSTTRSPDVCAAT